MRFFQLSLTGVSGLSIGAAARRPHSPSSIVAPSLPLPVQVRVDALAQALPALNAGDQVTFEQ